MEASISNDALVWKCIARLLEISSRARPQEMESPENSTPALAETFPTALSTHPKVAYPFARIQASGIKIKE